jgi:predicted nucleic-acid-binding protein
MSQNEEDEVQTKIAQIIERSRHHEEMFLIDSKTAAVDIMKYLQKEKLLQPLAIGN